MFARIARFDIRFRWPIVAVWVVLAVAAPRLLPSLASQTTSASFLPPDAPSQQAAALSAPFQSTTNTQTALIVAVRDGGPITAADEAAITRLETAVTQIPGVADVRDQGASADGQARRVLVVPAGSAGQASSANPALVGAIRGAFADAGAPPGFSLST